MLLVLTILRNYHDAIDLIELINIKVSWNHAFSASVIKIKLKKKKRNSKAI